MKRLIFFISFFCTANIALAQKPVKLQLNFEKGKIYYSESAISQEIQMMQPNGPITMKTSFTFGYDMKVSGETDSGKIIETTYRKVKISMMNMEFNSDTPTAGNPMFQKIFGGMIGKSFWLITNKNGELTSVKGMYDLVTAMIKDLPANPQMEAGLRNEYNDAKMLQNFSQNFNIYSAEKVKVGSWTKKYQNSLLGTGSASNTYTVTALTKSIATLKATGTHEMEPSIGAGGKLAGTSVLEMDVDVKSGFPVKGKMNMTLDGEMKNGEGTTPAKIITSIIITGSIK